MNIYSIKTKKIKPDSGNLLELLDKVVTKFPEKGILAITSKIVAILEGSIIPSISAEKDKLIEQEADYFIPRSQNPYNIVLTIKDNILIPSAGIDESNSEGYYVLWPKDSQKTGNEVRLYLQNRFNITRCGVIITDSKTTPLRRGTTGVCLAHSGFKALNDYVDQPDIYGKPMRVTKANIADGLAAAAVLIMGEGNEQTPLAIIQDTSFVAFTDENPSQEELADLRISLEDDLYGPILQSAPWHKGKNNE